MGAYDGAMTRFTTYQSAWDAAVDAGLHPFGIEWRDEEDAWIVLNAAGEPARLARRDA